MEKEQMRYSMDQELLERAASHIGKRPVEIRLSKPPNGRTGQAIRVENKAMIYINPDLEPMKFLWVLAHEAAHVRLHFKQMPTIEDINTKSLPVALDRLSYRLNPSIQTQEIQADGLADHLVSFAINNQDNFRNIYFDDFSRKLAALCYWQPNIKFFKFKG